MTAPNPSDLLTAALIATDRHARLSERLAPVTSPPVTEEQVVSARKDESGAVLTAYRAVGALAAVQELAKQWNALRAPSAIEKLMRADLNRALAGIEAAS